MPAKFFGYKVVSYLVYHMTYIRPITYCESNYIRIILSTSVSSKYTHFFKNKKMPGLTHHITTQSHDNLHVEMYMYICTCVHVYMPEGDE